MNTTLIRESNTRLSNEEFDSCLLKKKLTFQLSESARLVLVHGITPEEAAGIVGLRSKGDITKVNDTVAMIVESYQDHQIYSVK